MSRILLVIPVYNEEKIIEGSIFNIHDYFKKEISDNYEIIIANNGSTDKTLERSIELSKKIRNLHVINLKHRGRGNALKFCWTKFDADIYAYCDVDLATNLRFLKLLFDEIKKGNNLTLGSRYLKGSSARRSLKRLLFSKVYIWLVKLFFRTKIQDFQCGFKAIDKRTAKNILPMVKDKNWFFDTELVLTAENSGSKIKEIPVEWSEKKESKVKLFKTAIGYIIDIIKLKKRVWSTEKYIRNINR